MTAQYQFVMRSGPAAGNTYPLEGPEISIGREPTCNIAINDAEVSRKHARLVWKEGGYAIEDLGSTNGTFVNGQRISGTYTLLPGEVVTFGENISLLYEALYDPNATMLSSSARGTETAVSMKPVQAPSPAPVYSGQVPAGPAEVKIPGKKKISIWLILAIVILVVICACVLFFVLIDQLDLWCRLVPFIVPLFGGSCP